ncbi:unnamed protein product, partial [marine sediment metagenome]
RIIYKLKLIQCEVFLTQIGRKMEWGFFNHLSKSV